MSHRLKTSRTIGCLSATSFKTSVRTFSCVRSSSAAITSSSCSGSGSSECVGRMKLSDLVTLHIALFMHKFHNKLLPSYFDNFFNPVLSIHNYNTRSAANQSFTITIIFQNNYNPKG